LRRWCRSPNLTHNIYEDISRVENWEKLGVRNFELYSKTDREEIKILRTRVNRILRDLYSEAADFDMESDEPPDQRRLVSIIDVWSRISRFSDQWFLINGAAVTREYLNREILYIQKLDHFNSHIKGDRK
jgi:hypothetical protein